MVVVQLKWAFVLSLEVCNRRYELVRADLNRHFSGQRTAHEAKVSQRETHNPARRFGYCSTHGVHVTSGGGMQRKSRGKGYFVSKKRAIKLAISSCYYWSLRTVLSNKPRPDEARYGFFRACGLLESGGNGVSSRGVPALKEGAFTI